jgi:hypothetical protein
MTTRAGKHAPSRLGRTAWSRRVGHRRASGRDSTRHQPMVAARPFLERTGHAALARTRKGLCFGTVLFSFVGSSRLAPVHVLVGMPAGTLSLRRRFV